MLLEKAMRKQNSRKKKEHKHKKDRVKSLTKYYMSEDERKAKARDKFWCKANGSRCIKHKLLAKYTEALTTEEQSDTYDLRLGIDLDEVRQRLPPKSIFTPSGMCVAS